MPVISQRELNKLKNTQGVYSQLRTEKLENLVFESLPFVKVLRIELLKTIEHSFRVYVRSHKGKHITAKLEDESWVRFKTILQKYL
jgi:hypothetical protein